MRKIRKEIEAKLFTKELEEAYQFLDIYEKPEELSRIFGISIYMLSGSKREIAREVTAMNSESFDYCIASLPAYCGACYMAIKLEDRLKAVNIGLQVEYA